MGRLGRFAIVVDSAPLGWAEEGGDVALGLGLDMMATGGIVDTHCHVHMDGRVGGGDVGGLVGARWVAMAVGAW